MNYKQGAGGCCIECEIYLDYKDSYQCNNDECPCHKEEVGEKCSCITRKNFNEIVQIVNGCPIHDDFTPPLEVKEGSKDIEWVKKWLDKTGEYVFYEYGLDNVCLDGWFDIEDFLSQQEAKIKRELVEKIESMGTVDWGQGEYLHIDTITKLLSE